MLYYLIFIYMYIVLYFDIFIYIYIFNHQNVIKIQFALVNISSII